MHNNQENCGALPIDSQQEQIENYHEEINIDNGLQEMRDRFDKLIKTAQVRGFPQEPIRNLSLRIVFAEFIPQYRYYNHDIQEI